MKPKGSIGSNSILFWVILVLFLAGATWFFWAKIHKAYQDTSVELSNSHAAGSTLSLSPASVTIANGQTAAVDISLDTSSLPVDGIDILSIHFNPSILQVIDDNASANGVQITPQTSLPITTINVADNTAGTIQLSQATTPTSFFSGVGLVGTIHFRAIATGTSPITFDFTPGSTLDTNVAYQGTDQLVGVNNSNIVVSSGTPTAGTTFYLTGDSSDITGSTNGSQVIPAINASGTNGTVMVNGAGSVNFKSVQVGNGVYFKDGNQQQANSAYYKFSGTSLGQIFDAEKGEISFYLKSSYSWAERQALPPLQNRYVYDVSDSSGRVWVFNSMIFLSAPNRLKFVWGQDGYGGEYDVPVGQEDALFGSGQVLKVRVTWDATDHGSDRAVANLYLNDVLAQTLPYTYRAMNWTSGSVFSFGAQNCCGPTGGFFSSDEAIDEFKILGSGSVSSTPAPTPAPIVKSIQLNLQGRSSNALSGTLDILNSAKNYINSVNFTTGSSGAATVTITGLSPQTVYLKVFIAPFLSRLAQVDLSGSGTITFSQLLVGDLNHDNIINSLDYSALNGKWFTSDSSTDLNKDGIVNSIDFSFMNQNWLRSGEI